MGGHSVGGVVWVWVGEASQAVKVGAKAASRGKGLPVCRSGGVGVGEG